MSRTWHRGVAQLTRELVWFPNIHHSENCLILPPCGSKLVSSIRPNMLACELDNAKQMNTWFTV
jgi:hypothetical protein